jgi:osmotically-inducible protein OsmY
MTEEDQPLLVEEAETLISSGQPDEPPKDMEAEERTERMPPDISSLTDEEIEDYFREQLVEGGRIDLDAVQITFRGGVIHLDGALPSEEQHQILLQYVTDFAGIEEIIDRLVINELLWEREDRTDTPKDKETSSGTLSEALEDLIESDQEDRNYEPPAGPVQLLPVAA